MKLIKMLRFSNSALFRLARPRLADSPASSGSELGCSMNLLSKLELCRNWTGQGLRSRTRGLTQQKTHQTAQHIHTASISAGVQQSFNCELDRHQQLQRLPVRAVMLAGCLVMHWQCSAKPAWTTACLIRLTTQVRL